MVSQHLLEEVRFQEPCLTLGCPILKYREFFSKRCQSWHQFFWNQGRISRCVEFCWISAGLNLLVIIDIPTISVYILWQGGTRSIIMYMQSEKLVSSVRIAYSISLSTIRPRSSKCFDGPIVSIHCYSVWLATAPDSIPNIHLFATSGCVHVFPNHNYISGTIEV